MEPLQAVDLTASLKEKYERWMRDDIVEVRLVQSPERVWLEITRELPDGPDLLDYEIYRSDLGFVVEVDEQTEEETPFFASGVSVQENARKFLEDFDPYSILNTTELFGDHAEKEVEDLYG